MSSSNITEEHLRLLDEAIAQGVTTVRYKDREIVYRSFQDMMKTREFIKDQLQTKKQKTFIQMSYSKGN